MAEPFRPPGLGRTLVPGRTDISSEARTPQQPLRLIPAGARRSFVPFLEQIPGLREGENDLTRLAPGRPRAEGEVIAVTGRLSDTAGRPLRGALVEIWNANKWGRYTHDHDPARAPLDPNFLGFGRTKTDDEGGYRFLTIRPASYLARADIDRWRPAHIHFSIRGGSARLVTQMYFPGDEWLARDPLVHLLGEAQGRHIARPTGDALIDADRGFRFDIAIGGRNATWFQDHG